jgi:hypothetical protein
MADKRISQLVERVTLANNDVFPIVASGATTTNKVTLQTIDDYMQTNLNFGVTSVAMSVPTGLSVAGSPITSTGTFVVTFTAGYSIPTTAKQTQWDEAYTNRITSATAPLGIASNVISITQAGATTNGFLSSTDWNTFNNKQSTITTGNLTEATSSVLTITGGTGSVIGSGTSIEVKQASGSQDGFLDSADWTTFNGKQNALSGTGIVKSTGGTISYLTDSTSNWDSAYNDKINSASVTGTTTKTLTLNQQDGGTITTTWTDLDTGTVTSVGVSMPSAFSVANSPITSSGTIAITGAGTISQYIDGTGALRTFPSIISQATNLIREVYNNSGATMTKGTVVYINGGQGNLPTIAKALATGDSTSAQTYGVVQNSIGNMSNGYIVVVGDLIDMDTQAFVEGTQLYLSSSTAGEYTSTKQYAPNHLVYVGIVTRSHPTQGIIAVKIQNGYEMDELHDVSAQNPNDNDILQYKTATGLWTKTAGTTSNIAEGSRLYYTDARSRAAISESVTGLDYNSSTGVLSTTTGYAIPTTASQTNWDAAYNDKINSAAVSGTTTKTLTLTQQDGGTITASWTDINTDAVSSVFGRTGAVVATSGDYNTDQVTEGSSSLYFTNARSRSSISLTTTGTSGAATYNSTTGVLNIPSYVGGVTSVNTLTGAVVLTTSNIAEGTNLYYTDTRARAAISLTTTGSSGAATYSAGTLNVPNYTLAGLGGVPTSRTLTINGTAFDLSADRSWTITAGVSGSGTTNTIPKWTSSTGLGNSILKSTAHVDAVSSGSALGTQDIFFVGRFLQDETTYRGVAIGYQSTNQRGILYGESAGASSSLGFATYHSPTATWAQRMFIYHDGVVILGTSSTAYNLVIQNSNSLTGLYATDGGGLTKDFVISTGGSSGAGSIKMFANCNVHVAGSNVTDKNYKFYVDGTSYVNGKGRFAQEIYINSASGLTGEQGLIYFNNSPSNAGSRSWRISNDQNSWGDFAIQVSTTQTGTTFNTPLNIDSTGVSTFNRPAMTTQSSYDYRNIIVSTGFAGGYSSARIQSLLAGYDTSIYGVDIGYAYNTAGYNLIFSTNDNTVGLPIQRLKIDSYGDMIFYGTATSDANAANFRNSSSALSFFAGDSNSSTKEFQWFVTNGSTQFLGMQLRTNGYLYLPKSRLIGDTDIAYMDLYNNNIGNIRIVNTSTNSLYGNIQLFTSDVLRFQILTDGQILFKGNSTNSLASTYIQNTNSELGIYSTEGGGTTKNIMISSGGSGGSNALRIFASGNNQFSANNLADQGYKLYVAGTIYATGDVIAFSDIKVKENIRNIENPLEKISKSRGVLYDRKDNGDKDNIGFIAHELEQQFPELVATNKDGSKGVKYQNAVAVLFEAIKEQQKQINNLKSLIN